MSFPSDELVPVEEHPESLLDLITQSVGSSITDRWGDVSIPVTEEEFKKFNEEFRNMPFAVMVPRRFGATPEGVTLTEVINRVRMEHKSFRSDELPQSEEDVWKGAKVAELMTSDHFPQGREISFLRLANFFSDVYRREIARLEEELLKLSEGKAELDERTKQEIIEKLEDFKRRERGIGVLIEARRALLEDIKNHMKKRWKVVEDLLDDEVKEALKKLTDVNVKSFTGEKKVPEAVYEFLQDLRNALLNYRGALDKAVHKGRLEEFFKTRYENNPKFRAMIEAMEKAEGGYYLPYMSYFAGSLVMLEEYIKPVLEKHEEELRKAQEEGKKRRELEKAKLKYFRMIREVLEKPTEENLEKVKEQGGEKGKIAEVLLNYLKQVKDARRVDIETKEKIISLSPPKPEEGYSEELVSALEDVAKSLHEVRVKDEGDLLRKIRAVAKDLENRAEIGVGGERSEFEVLEEELKVIENVAKNIELLRKKIDTETGFFKLSRLSEDEAHELLKNIRIRFFIGEGKELDRKEYEDNLRTFYNLELAVEKLMSGELTAESATALFEDPAFGIRDYVMRKFGTQAYADVRHAFVSMAKESYRSQNVLPHFLSPEEYIKIIRDYVATSRIKKMVEEEGQGIFFRRDAVEFLKKKVASALGILPYQASLKLESCIRQALYPDVSAMNYAPSHRLKMCISERL